jgi:hypothetical protein
MADAEMDCPLLDLPAELRNRIYDLVLTERFWANIRVHDHRFVGPALLQTCRQIRQDASQIFYVQSFDLIVDNTDFGPQLKHWIWTKVDSERRMLYHVGDCTWEKLAVWFKMCQEGTIDVPGVMSQDYPSMGKTIHRAFQIATAMRGSSWEVTEQVLEEFKLAVEYASEAPYRYEHIWGRVRGR